MIARTLILWIVALHLSLVSHADARDQSRGFVRASDLRSAYLQRAGVVAYDESDISPAGLRKQLRRHFDAVLGVLDLATPRSIETALARLEAADGYSWTPDERIARRRELTAARGVQMQRISAYRDGGVFPLNEGQSSEPAPIFVDRHGTDCAVGHLMRCSGWANEVDAIARSNNLVYVPDAPQSAIAVWVLTSGLTLEEAALIQPGYSWTNAEFDASAYEPGELVIERNGLRFSNFRLQAQNYLGSGTPTNTGTKPTLAGLGLSTGAGTYSSPVSGSFFITHVPIGTNFLAIAPSNPQTGLHDLDAFAPSSRSQLVLINFDVAAILPNQRINGISESSYEFKDGFRGQSGSVATDVEYYLETTVRDGTTSIASIYIDESTPGAGFIGKSDTESFTARQQISVEAELWLEGGFNDGVRMDTFMLDFNVVTVPEPASAMLVVTFIGCCICRVRT